MIGKTIGHYQIIEKLGEGGMGVVYKASDAHLDRFVAIKVLPPERVADADRKRRFIQEAKTASALNHPSIITIYDIDEADGMDFIAMEYIAGKTLDELIPRKGLRLTLILKYAVQIADALARAHAAGIIHRDVKPSNVMVNEHGLVKVLDFGLAKLKESIPYDISGTTATIETQEVSVTEKGSIVGTVAYMSPEQAEGKPLDARSDIFSFGSVLYEMVNGRRAFQGDSKISTLSAILNQEPKPLEDVPHDLEKVITRCLRKDPERRFQNMSDLKVELAELREESESGSLTRGTTSAAKYRSRRWWWAGATVMILAGLALYAWLWLRPVPYQLPSWHLRQLTSDDAVSLWGTLSPDGKLMAFVSDRVGRGQMDLFIQQVSGGSPVRLTDGKQKVNAIAFAPDGMQIVYGTIGQDSAIWGIPTVGGESRRIADRNKNETTLKVSPDGTWICSYELVGPYSGQFRVTPLAGGQTKLVAPRVFQNGNFIWSPDSQGLLLRAGLSHEAFVGGDTDLWFIGINGETSATGVGPIAMASGLSSFSPRTWVGSRLFVTGYKAGATDLWQVRLPATSKKASGTMQPLTSGWTGRAVSSVAADGRRMLFTDTAAARTSIWVLTVDAETGKISGAPQRVSQGLSNEDSAVALEGGQRILFDRWAGDRWSFHTRDLASGKETLLVEVQNPLAPVASRDGSRFAYVSHEDKKRVVYVASTRGGAPRRVCEACGRPTDWSPDGTKLLAHDLNGKPGQAGFIDIDTGGTKVFLEHTQRIYNPVLSPDGRWVVFTLHPPGPMRTYVAPYREDRIIPENEWILLRQSDFYERYFRWSPRGEALYFLRRPYGENRDSIWAIPFQRTSGKPLGEAIPVFEPEDWRLMPYGDPSVIGISLVPGRLFFSQAEIKTNIWLAEVEK